ncbi:MAG: hypothetical protein C4342_02645 [Armatimonadota bacterium]
MASALMPGSITRLWSRRGKFIGLMLCQAAGWPTCQLLRSMTAASALASSLFGRFPPQRRIFPGENEQAELCSPMAPSEKPEVTTCQV